MLLRSLLLLLVVIAAASRCVADDGYRLWLKYDLVADARQRAQYRAAAQFVAASGNDAVLKTAATELQRGLQGLLGQPVPVRASAGQSSTKHGVILVVNSTANVFGGSTSPDAYHLGTQGNT